MVESCEKAKVDDAKYQQNALKNWNILDSFKALNKTIHTFIKLNIDGR